MAQRSSRSRRMLSKALASRRKLCFDSDCFGDDCTKSVQDSELRPQILQDSELRPQILQDSELRPQSTLHACAGNTSTQSKVLILSDLLICGPSNPNPSVSESFSNISESAKQLCEKQTKPLSPVIIDQNDKQNTFSPDSPVTYNTLQNVSIVELPPQDKVILENTSIAYGPDADTESAKQLCGKQTKPLSPVIIDQNDKQNTFSPDSPVTYNTLQNVSIVELPPQDKVILENTSIAYGPVTTNNAEVASSNKNKKKSKRQNQTISYMDFMSDDEDFQLTSSSWDGEDETSDSDVAEPNAKKKKSKHAVKDGKVGDLGFKKKKKINKRKQRSVAKNSGVSYTKQDGTIAAQKTMKENPCKPEKKCRNNCHEISEERRQQIFDYYYNLSSQRKRDWLVANSQKVDIKRKRTKETVSRRQSTYNYFINEGEGRRQVCQKFILDTLNLSQRFVHYTLSSSESNLSKIDLRGKHIPSNKTSALVKEGVVDYIKNLPAVPSHYCRKDSTRLYLPNEFKNLSHLYQLYKTEFSYKGKDYVGEKVFKNIFTTEFNISFHIPKKDKCKKCLQFASNLATSEEDKKAHLKDADDTKARFKFHQKYGKHNPQTLCVTFDLQKVLNTPYGESMLLYYSRKYSVFNLTFYESITREGYCFSWGECDGKRGGNEVATILYNYIKIVDERQAIKNLILYSDSCCGQNKNKIVFAAVHTALQSCHYLETIQMNFLLPGHTCMPVDSMHAIIENSVKNTIIHAPSQWSTVFTLARKTPKPYNVKVLKYTDFVAWDSITNKFFKNDLAGKIKNLRVITFKKNEPTNVSLKTSMAKESSIEKIVVSGKSRIPSDILYKKPLSISDIKYKNLTTLCKELAIPEQFHDEYMKMPHGNVTDKLPETDLEDSD